MTNVRWVWSDAVAMTGRNLRRYVRIPTLVVFSTIQPIMFLVLFSQVFGGALQRGLPAGFSYVDFLMPGIIAQSCIFGAIATGLALAEDLQKGMIDRFRSLPMARSAVLAGRTAADTIRNLFVVLLMIVVGIVIGFRFHQGAVNAVLAVLLVLFFGLAFSWVSATIGLAVGNVETAQSAGFIWVFPLVFASSAFAQVSTMPGWLQSFVHWNPVSTLIDALRGLLDYGDVSTPLWQSLVWVAVILAVFVPLAVQRYRRT